MRGLIKRFVITSSLVLLVFSLSLACMPFNAVASDEASLVISEANNKLKMAFEAVLDAEKAGANVSDLIIQLNSAGVLLAEAENAYRVGVFSEAVSKAEECSMLADGVMGEALQLRDSAIVNAQTVFWHNLMFSIFEGAAFLFVIFFVWGWFRRVYVKRIVNMKPEVVSDDEA